MLDTLQIYDDPSDGIKPIDLQSDALEGIDKLCIEDVSMSKQELAQIKQAAWTPVQDSLQIYEEFAQIEQKEEFQFTQTFCKGFGKLINPIKEQVEILKVAVQELK